MKDSGASANAADMSEISDRIREIRGTLEKTQEEFAAMLGVSRGAVGNWENGGGVSRENLALISRLTGASLTWLMDGTGEAGQTSAPPPSRPGSHEFERLKYAYAAFLEALSDEATGIRWLEIIEELEEVSRPPAGSPESPLNLDRIRTQAQTIAALAKRRLRINKEKKT